jgi:hypothetical protein
MTIEDQATSDSAGEGADGGGVRWLGGLVPRRLGPGITTTPAGSLPVLQLALRLQTLGGRAHLWEAAGGEENRMYEIAGCLAGMGEQLGLACTAERDYVGWETLDLDGDEAIEAEMAKRALAEVLAHYTLAAGHGLTNVTGRSIALDHTLHELLQTQCKTSFPPLSDKREDWLSANRSMARKLQRVARTSGIPEIRTVADPVVGMTESEAWYDLIDGRGADFHRWRVQTAGICGAAKQSPWRHGEGFRTIELAFGQVLSAENEARLAAETMAMAMAARAQLVTAIEAFMPMFQAAVAETTAMTLLGWQTS